MMNNTDRFSIMVIIIVGILVLSPFVFVNLNAQQSSAVLMGKPKVTPVSITLVSPKAGDIFAGGSTQTVQWQITYGTAPYKVWANYSTSGPAGPWNPITTIQGASQAATGNGNGTWVLPMTDSANCRLYLFVLDSGHTNSYDETSGNFIISTTPPHVVSVYPANGAVNVRATDQIIITFSELMNISNTEGAFSIQPDPSNWTWTWYASNYTLMGKHLPYNPGSTYNVTISTAATDLIGHNLPAAYLWSFTTASGPGPIYIMLKSPIGNENWTSGTVHNIIWLMGGGNGTLHVLLEYSIDGGLNYAQIVPDVGVLSYAWTVANLGTTQYSCFVKATVTDNAIPPDSYYDMSGSNFTIYVPPGQGPPVITLNSPHGGEIWMVDSHHDIEWNVTNGILPMAVELNYSTQGVSGPYTSIVTGLNPFVGNYSWTVPNAPSANCYIQAFVKETGSSGRGDSVASHSAFTILAPSPITVSVLNPALGEKIGVGLNYTIKWNRTGGYSPFTTLIELSTNSQSSWSTVASNATDAGVDSSKLWKVPSTVSITCNIRISVKDIIGESTVTISDQFQIAPVSQVGQGNIEGYVVIENKVPADSTRIVVVGTSINATTDETGYFFMSGISSGKCSIIISRSGYADKRVDNINVYNGQTTNVGTIQLQKPQISLPLWEIAAITIVAIIIVIVVLMLLLSMRNKKNDSSQKKPQYPSQFSTPQGYQQQPQTSAPGSSRSQSSSFIPAPQSSASSTEGQAIGGQASGSHMKKCKRCGAENESWRLSCSQCKSNLGGL